MNNKNGPRWLYLAVGTVMMMFLGLIYAWSIFRAPLMEIYPDWTASQLSMTFTISMIFFCLGGFFSGMMFKSLSPQHIAVIAGAVVFLGFFGVSRMNPTDSATSLKVIHIFYGILCGSGVGCTYNTVLSTINKWFKDRPGLSSGVLLMGFGLGGIVLGSVINDLVGQNGILRTFQMLSIALPVVIFAGSFFLKLPESEDTKVKAYNDEGSVESIDNYTTSEMIKSVSFWMFWVWGLLISASGLLVIGNAASISKAYGGPATLGLIVSLANGIGRVLFGSVFDKFGRKRALLVNVVFLFIAAGYLIAGAGRSKLILIVAGLIFIGLSYGGSPAMNAAVIYKYYGPKNYAVNLSIANSLFIPAAILGPTTASKILEKTNGSYTTTFMAIVAFAAISAVLSLLLKDKEAMGVKKKEPMAY